MIAFFPSADGVNQKKRITEKKLPEGKEKNYQRVRKELSEEKFPRRAMRLLKEYQIKNEIKNNEI